MPQTVTARKGWLNLLQYADMMVAVAVVAIVMIIIIPVPTWALDLLLSLSLVERSLGHVADKHATRTRPTPCQFPLVLTFPGSKAPESAGIFHLNEQWRLPTVLFPLVQVNEPKRYRPVLHHWLA